MPILQEAEPPPGQPEVGIRSRDIARWGGSATVDGYCRVIQVSLSVWVEAPVLRC